MGKENRGADILLTGSTGFIGSHLAGELVARGRRVRCLVRRTSDRSVLPGEGVELAEGDLGDPDALRRAVKGIRIVFHAAAVLQARTEEEFIRANEVGTRNLLDAIVRPGEPVERFVYISSQSASGPSPGLDPIDEDASPRPVSAYGRTKLRGEEMLREGTLPFVILRPGIVYGPRERDVYNFFRMTRMRVLPLPGLRTGYSNAIHVDDVVRASVLAAEVKEALGRTYFLNDGQVYTWSSLIREIARVVERRCVVVPIPLVLLRLVAFLGPCLGGGRGRALFLSRDKVREIEGRTWIASARRIREELGFEAAIGLRDGLARTAAWYRENGWL